MHHFRASLSVLFLFFSSQCSINSHAQAFNYRWGKQIGGKNYQSGTAVCFDNKGNTIVGGGWQTNIDFNPPNLFDTSDGTGYNDNVFVVKYDPAGKQLWRFVLKSTGPGFSITDLETDLQGNIIIGGSYTSIIDLDPDSAKKSLTTIGGYSSSFIAKYDKDGTYLWSVLLKSGGAFSTSVRDLEIGPQGDVYITGSFQQTVDFDPDSAVAKILNGSSNSIFIARYSAAGKYKDVHFFYCADANYSYPTGLGVDKGGNVFVTGNLFSNTFAVNGFLYPNGPQLVSKGYGDIFLVKLNASLDPVWWSAMCTDDREVPTALVLDDSSNVFITGDYIKPLDMDPGANTWILKHDIMPQSRQVFVAKYDSSGNIRWARTFEGKGSIGASIDLDMNRNVFLSLGAADTVWLNPGVDKAFIFATGGHPGFVKMNPNGKALYGNIYPGQDMVQTQSSMDADPSGNLAFTNNFFGQIDLDFSAGTAIMNSVNYVDGFTAVYSTCTPAGLTVKPKILAAADSLCSGDSMRLRIVNKGYNSISWSTGMRDTFITIHSPGKYKVAVVKGCDMPSVDSIVIRQGKCNQTDLQQATFNSKFCLYPNPASAQVQLKTDTQEELQCIVISDMKGCLLLIKYVQKLSNNYLLDVSCLNTGNYLIKVVTDRNVYHQKLVIER